MQVFRVIPFIKLQNDTETELNGEKWELSHEAKTRQESNLAQPKTGKWFSSPSHFA